MFDPPKWLLDFAGVMLAIGLLSWVVTTGLDNSGVFDFE